MARPWTHSESLFLKRDAERCGLPWCAAELRRTVEDCAVQLKALSALDMPKKAPERPVEAKEDVSAVVLQNKAGDAPERLLGAKNGGAENFIPAAPLPDEQPPQVMDLASMTRLDILRAIAAGKMEVGFVG